MPNQSPVVTPTLAEFEAAHAIVAQVAIETPVLHSNFLSKLTGADVWLKAETLQRTGAYKVRGAYHRMSKLTAAERKRASWQHPLVTTLRAWLSPPRSLASRPPSSCL